MSVQRSFPTFAPLTLRDWFLSRPARNDGGPRIVLWPDTFNNYLHPSVGVAAVEVLEAAGYHVVMPREHLCCGRPLYDYGMLDLARRYFRGILDELRDEIRAGVPFVDIEPSCVATFKSELRSLLSHDDDAARLAGRSYHFAEFLVHGGVELPRLERRALFWRHCHQNATCGVAPEHELLRTIGIELDRPDRRLLRPGGVVGLRGCALRPLDRHRRARPAPEGARGRRGHAARHRRVLLQDANRTRRTRAARAAGRGGDQAGARARADRPSGPLPGEVSRGAPRASRPARQWAGGQRWWRAPALLQPHSQSPDADVQNVGASRTARALVFESTAITDRGMDGDAVTRPERR